MADENQISTEKVKEFMNITNMEREMAIKFLEASGWDFDLALDHFYEDPEDYSPPQEMEQPKQQPVPPKQFPPPPRNDSRIVTLGSLMQNEEQDEGGQAFYAGGSTRSGQQVLGPSSNRHRIVDEMFKAAKSHGAEEVEASASRTGSSPHLRVFRGAGHVLSTSDIQPGEEEPQQPITISLRAWRNGFTVDDGPLRDYSDPQNCEFLTAVRRGEIPIELLHKAKGREVSLDLEDHSQEEYTPPKQSLHAFSGEGHRLGSPVPRNVGSVQPQSPESTAEAEKYLNVNQDLPVTVIQIRLADGRRVPLKLNHTHTIGQIRQYIVLAYPEYVASVFTLMTAYPPAELVNDNETVEEAKLLNSVIIQKLLR